MAAGSMLFGAALPDGNEVIKASLCQMVKTPTDFHGRVVQVHADVIPPGIDTGPFLVDRSCSGRVAIKDWYQPVNRVPVSGQLYLLYIFGRHMRNMREFEATVAGKFELLLVPGGKQVFFFTVERVADLGQKQPSQ